MGPRWRAWLSAGGYPFPCDPDLAPGEVPAIWAPSLATTTVVLDAAPDGFEDARPLDIDALEPILADRLLADGRHLVLADDQGRHRLWLRDTTPGRRLAITIPDDDHYELRSAAASRLRRRLRGLPAGRPPLGCRPTPFQRRRLILLLNLAEAALAGAGPRDMAIHLTYPRMPPLSAAAWKDSPERQRTRRLAKEATALVQGGYRALLAGR